MVAGDVDQHRGAPAVGRAGERRPRRRVDVPRDRARDRVRRGRVRSRPRGRASPSASGRPWRRGLGFGIDVEQAPLAAARRPRARARGCCGLRSRACGRSACPQLVTLVGVPGIGKSRLVARAVLDRRRTIPSSSSGGRAAASRTARASLLGARRDGEGAGGHPRERLRAERPRRSSRAAVAALVPDTAEAAWVDGAPAAARRSRRGGGRRRRQSRRGVRRLAALLRGARRSSARSCSSSRICTGPTTGCSTSSTTSSTGRRGVPLLVVCTRAARSCSSGARAGAAASANARHVSLVAALRRGDGAADRGAARAGRCCPPSAGRRCSPRAGGNPLYAEEYVRMLRDRGFSSARVVMAARQASSMSRDGAGDHRRPARRALARTRRRCSRTLPWSGRSSGSARSPRSPTSRAWDAEERLHALERKEFVRRDRRSSVAGETRVRVPPRARPRRRLRADSARAPRRAAPARRRVDRVARPVGRTRPRCSRTTTWQRARARPGSGGDPTGIASLCVPAARGWGPCLRPLISLDSAERL